ncbi:hypothetical protein C2845_PM17G01240 [Panicum miliaceum]|uniref:Uncharacterized protein n=1 Tax=Panicum miliaceum TaxID=4540 RepID=A0A3L6Q214_PANMI|nr:hypothetical protein C2845_PM17G01240 [Panicum miliaceum]
MEMLTETVASHERSHRFVPDGRMAQAKLSQPKLKLIQNTLETSSEFAHARAVALGREVFLIGRGATLRVDALTGAARACAPTLFPRKKFAAAAVGGRIYVAGGSARTAAVEEYDLAADAWRVVAEAPRRRYGCAGAGGRRRVLRRRRGGHVRTLRRGRRAGARVGGRAARGVGRVGVVGAAAGGARRGVRRGRVRRRGRPPLRGGEPRGGPLLLAVERRRCEPRRRRRRARVGGTGGPARAPGLGGPGHGGARGDGRCGRRPGGGCGERGGRQRPQRGGRRRSTGRAGAGVRHRLRQVEPRARPAAGVPAAPAACAAVER